MTNDTPKDAYSRILAAIDEGEFSPGDRMVESELADRFGISRTPIREALQRLETQSMLTREGRSLMVASLSHNELAQLYEVRAELEGLAAALAAKHASDEEIRVLYAMIESDYKIIDDPRTLQRTNRRFHSQIHLTSRNQYLVRQLSVVHRTMALMGDTSLAATGRGSNALEEHTAVIQAIEARDAETANAAIKKHLSRAFETRLRTNADKN